MVSGGVADAKEREHHQPAPPPQQQRALTYSLRFMAKNAAGRSLESILQAVKHDYCFEPFTAEDKPQNKNEIKAQLLRFAVKFYHQIHRTRREKRGLIRAESLLTRQSLFSLSRAVCAAFLQIPALLFPLSLYLFFEPRRIKRERECCAAGSASPILDSLSSPPACRPDGWKESCWILEKKSLTAPEWNLFFYARPPGWMPGWLCVQFYRAHPKKGMAGARTHTHPQTLSSQGVLYERKI